MSTPRTTTVATNACATCPRPATFGCDVDTLRITARVAGGDERTILAPRRMREALDEPTRRSYPAHIHQHLQNNDVILDCTAGYKDNYFLTTDSSETVQQLSAEATFHKAGNCPSGEHQLITAKVAYGASQRLAGSTNTTQLVNWPGDSIRANAVSIKWPPSNETRSFLSSSIFQGSTREPNDVTFLWFLLFAIMDTQKPKTILVTAAGHGVRKDNHPARTSLRGLIRVFREDTFKLVFSYKGTGFERQVEQPEVGVANTQQGQVLWDTLMARPPVTTGRKLFAQAQQTRRAAGQGFVEFVRGVEPTEPSIAIELQLNNASVGIDQEKAQKLQQMYAQLQQLNLARYLPALSGGRASLGIYLSALWTLSVGALKKRIQQVLTTLRNCVKCGFWLEFDFRWCDGILGFKYATKDGPSYPRYKSIVHGFSLFFELNLLHLNFSMNFGVKAQFGQFAGVWAYAFIRIEFLVQLNGEVSLDSENAGTTGWGVVSEGEFAIGATAGANLLGAGVTVSAEGRATLRVKAALSISNNPDEESELSNEGSVTPVTFDYHARVHFPGLPDGESHGQWKPWGTTPIELWKQQTT
jgi:hypothetical protein